MDPFQYQQQQQLQYQQQYGQQQVQFVPAYPYNVQAQTNQQTTASGQYGGTFTAFPQPIVGLYPSVVPDTQFSQTQGHTQVFTPTPYAGQSLVTPTYQTQFAGGFQFQQQQPATTLQTNEAVNKSSLLATSSTSFTPPTMNFPSIPVASISGVQPNLNDVNQQYTQQYQQWQQQYNEWQAQHANHPDKKLFQEYQKQVEQWTQQQQQQMLQNQPQTLQATPSQMVQSIPGPSVNNPSSHVSQQTGVKQQFPSMQLNSSTNFPNQNTDLNRNDQQNNTQNFPKSTKADRNITQYGKNNENKQTDHSQWQQGQQHQHGMNNDNKQTDHSQWQQGQQRQHLMINDNKQKDHSQWQQGQQQQHGIINDNKRTDHNQWQQGQQQQHGKINDNKRTDYNQWQQGQQQQQPHNPHKWQNPNSNMNSNWPQGSAGNPKSNFSKQNSNESGLKLDNKPSLTLPKWMQSQGNQPQPEHSKTTEIKPSTPKWMQGEVKATPTDKASAKELPKWLQGSNKGEVNKQQQDTQGNEPAKEQSQEKIIKEIKPIPKWLQESNRTTSPQTTTTTQAAVTKQPKSSQAQQPSTSTTLLTGSSALSGIHNIHKLDPKQELELLQKQSIQLLQLAELEKKNKENKSANQSLLQKPTESEQKTDIHKNQPTTADNNKGSEVSSNKETLTTQTPSSEPPTQDVFQGKSTGKPPMNNVIISKDELQKPKAPVSKLKSIPCRFFPICRYGVECKFRHPPCTQGKSCTSKDCILDHSALSDEPPGKDLKESSFGTLSKQDVKIPGIGDESTYVKPAVGNEEKQPPILQESKPVEGNDYGPPKQGTDGMSRYPEERTGEDLNRWKDEDEWQRWRNERGRDYVDRDDRMMPPREQPPPTWDERERPYPQNRNEWERSERERAWRDHWERSPERFSERDRWLPPRDEEYRRYENERWERPPPDNWDYPPYREDRSRPPLSPRYRREPEFRERSPPRDLRDRPYYDPEFRNEPPGPRRYEEVDRYGRPLSPPPPDDYDRRREWEDRRREYYRPPSREPDWRDWRDSQPPDRQSDRYVEDYSYPGRGRSPPLDPSRPSVYDRPRYRDYPPDYDGRDVYRDRRDVERAQDYRHDVHPDYRRNPGAYHEDRGYQDHPPPRDVVKPDKPKAIVVPVETILDKPGRDSRPDRIVIIMRGLPGSGKTHVARLVKDKEASNGAHAPRIISLDDYFLTEVEKKEKDPDTGKSVTKKVTEYLYEAEMEDSYRASMFKSFSKTLEDGFFPVVMVDAINNKLEHFEKYWSLAKQKGFEVYIAELSADVHVCAKRNSHNRTFEEISKIQSEWKETPSHMLRLDVRSLLQDAVITEVEMEAADETTAKDSGKTESKTDNDEEDEGGFKSGIQLPQRSKWDDMDSGSAEAQLNKLDGIKPLKRKREASPPLTLSDDEDPYDEKEEDMRIGKKRVRWADIEERKHMEHRRRIGFCIGTDWSLLTDPNAKIPEH